MPQNFDGGEQLGRPSRLEYRTPAEVEQELVDYAAERLRPLLKDPKQAPQALAMVVRAVESYSVSIPHTKHLAGIEAVVPGGARDLLDMVRIAGALTRPPAFGIIGYFSAHPGSFT